MSKNKNNGTPRNEVNMPTGNTMGDMMVRATVSQSNKNIPPKTAEPVIRNSSLFPIHFLTIWGTTSPTKAITPKKDTAIAVHREVTINPITRVRWGNTPILVDVYKRQPWRCPSVPVSGVR